MERINFKIIQHVDNTYDIHSTHIPFMYRSGYYRDDLSAEQVIVEMDKIDILLRKEYKMKAVFYMQ